MARETCDSRMGAKVKASQLAPMSSRVLLTPWGVALAVGVKMSFLALKVVWGGELGSKIAEGGAIVKFEAFKGVLGRVNTARGV
jgi:hypothetical protein